MKKQTNPSIKAHLLWSALILLALGAVCAIPFALGQRQAVKLSVINPAAKKDAAANKYMQQVTQRADGAISDQPLPKISQTGQSQLPTTFSGAIGVGRLRILPNPNLPQVVLYDQYNNASPNHTWSATFTDFPTFGSDLADDFVVPGGQTWNVQSIDADGGVLQGPWTCHRLECFHLHRQQYSSWHSNFQRAQPDGLGSRHHVHGKPARPGGSDCWHLLDRDPSQYGFRNAG
jgi:hypothetical protein